MQKQYYYIVLTKKYSCLHFCSEAESNSNNKICPHLIFASIQQFSLNHHTIMHKYVLLCSKLYNATALRTENVNVEIPFEPITDFKIPLIITLFFFLNDRNLGNLAVHCYPSLVKHLPVQLPYSKGLYWVIAPCISGQLLDKGQPVHNSPLFKISNLCC